MATQIELSLWTEDERAAEEARVRRLAAMRKFQASLERAVALNNALWKNAPPPPVQIEFRGILGSALEAQISDPEGYGSLLEAATRRVFPDESALFDVSGRPRQVRLGRLLSHWMLEQGQAKVSLSLGEIIAVHDGFTAVTDRRTREFLHGAGTLTELFGQGAQEAMGRMEPRLLALADLEALHRATGGKPTTTHWQREMPDEDLAFVVAYTNMGRAFRPSTTTPLGDIQAVCLANCDLSAARDGRFRAAWKAKEAPPLLTGGDFRPRLTFAEAQVRANDPRRSDESLPAYLNRVPWGEYVARRWGKHIQDDTQAGAYLGGYLDGIDRFTPLRPDADGEPTEQSIAKAVNLWIRNRAGDVRNMSTPFSASRDLTDLSRKISATAYGLCEEAGGHLDWADAVEQAAAALPPATQAGINFASAKQMAVLGRSVAADGAGIYGDRDSDFAQAEEPDAEDETLASIEDPDDRFAHVPDGERGEPGIPPAWMLRAAGMPEIIETLPVDEPMDAMTLYKTATGQRITPEARTQMEDLLRKKLGADAVRTWTAAAAYLREHPLPKDRVPRVTELLDQAGRVRLAGQTARHLAADSAENLAVG